MAQAMVGSGEFDPVRLVRVLAQYEVEYVVIGALAARLAGYPLATYDSDITPSKTAENLVRLSRALRAMDARVYTASLPEGLPFDCSPQMLERADAWNLVTSVGRLDILFSPAGSGGFEELARTANQYEVFGVVVPAASLEAIVKMKEATDRPKDRQAVAIIKAMLARDARRS